MHNSGAHSPSAPSSSTDPPSTMTQSQSQFQSQSQSQSGSRVNCLLLISIVCLSLTLVQAQTPIPWSTLTQAQLSALQPTDIASATADNLGSIPATACPGFTATLLGAAASGSPYDQCSGFTAACLAVIPPNAFSSLYDECTGSFSVAGWGGITGDAVANMPASGFALITATNLAGLTSGCSGITSTQVGKLALNSPYDACSGLQASCVSVAPANFLSSLGVSCASSMSTAAIAQMTSNQFTAIPYTAIAGFVEAQIGAMTTACGGLTVYQAQQLGVNSPYTACAGFTVTCLESVPNAAFGGFSMMCMSTLTTNALSKVTADQIANLGTAGASGLLSATLGAIQPSACGGFSSQQLAALGTNSPYTTCQGFTNACLANLTPASAAGFTAFCIGNIPTTAITGITSSTMPYLSYDSVGGITQGQAAVLTTGCSGFTKAQTANFGATSPYNTCGGFTSACLGLFTNDALYQLVPACTNQFTGEAVSAWTGVQIGSLSNAGVGGLSSAAIGGIAPQSAGGFLAAQLAALQQASPYDSCQGWKKAALTNIVGAANGFTSACISNIPATEIVGFTLKGLQVMTPSAISGFLYAQLLALVQVNYQNFVDLWSVAQANAILPSEMIQWNAAVDAGTIPAGETWTTNTDLTQISQLQLSTCTTGCMSFLFSTSATPNTLPAVSWGGMRASLVKAVGPASVASNSAATVVGAISWLTSLQSWSGWPDAAVGGLSASQVASLPPTTVAVLNPAAFAPSAMEGLSDADIRAIPAQSWLNVANNCPNWKGMNYEQQQYLFNTYQGTEQQIVQACGPAYTSTGGGPPVPTPSSSSSSSGSSSPSSSSTGSGDPSGDSGLSPGAIAGIVIGVLAGVTVGAVVFWYCCLRAVKPQDGYVGIV